MNQDEGRFTRYMLNGLTSVSPLFNNTACGIYILEFANGDRYVGQAKDFRRRFTQHVHGSKHHEPWKDVVAVQFRHVPEEA